MDEVESTMKYNIGDAPEGEYLGDSMSWEEVARALWDLLDNIDTLPDMLHPSNYEMADKTWRMMVNRANMRHKYLKTDGYNLRK